jgi:hypothetical protein
MAKQPRQSTRVEAWAMMRMMVRKTIIAKAI